MIQSESWLGMATSGCCSHVAYGTVLREYCDEDPSLGFELFQRMAAKWRSGFNPRARACSDPVRRFHQLVANTPSEQRLV